MRYINLKLTYLLTYLSYRDSTKRVCYCTINLSDSRVLAYRLLIYLSTLRDGGMYHRHLLSG